MSEPRRGEPPLDSLHRLVRRSAAAVNDVGAGHRPSPGTPAEYARLQRAIDRRRMQHRFRRRCAAGVATVSVAAAFIFAVFFPRPPAVTYIVQGEGSAGPADGRLEAPAGRSVPVSFSDGTEIVLSAGGRAAVLATDSRGAQLRIDEGRAHFAVMHRPGARWSVAAGPYTIQVVGTEFDVTWTAGAQLLEVALTSGAVTVEGPPPLPLSLQAGRRLQVRGADHRLEITTMESSPAARAPAEPVQTTGPEPPGLAVREAPPVFDRGGSRPETRPARRLSTRRLESVPASAPAMTTPPAPALAPPPSDESAPLPERSRPSIGWAARMASGDYQRVVNEALAADLERSLQTRPSEDLWALGDAARYLGRADVARRTLLAQRRRFPHTENAVKAAFHLGALAEQQSASSSEALRWYDAYLSEAPAGALVPETLRRKMSLLQQSGEMAGARSAAERYRRDFPGGPYRRQADRILGQP